MGGALATKSSYVLIVKDEGKSVGDWADKALRETTTTEGGGGKGKNFIQDKKK